MISTKLTYIGLAIALGYGLIGCSSSDNPTTTPEGGATGGGSGTGGGGGTGGGAAGTGGGNAGTGGGTAGTGGGSAEAGATPTCDAYCTAIMKNCTGGDGTDGGATNQQYSSKDNCMKVCSTFPVGKASDSAGDTLGCRLTHANLAPTDPKLHCPHAGPGGDNQCGKPCDSYCRIVDAFCTADAGAKIYSSDTECKARCDATPSDQHFNIGIQEANQVACLLYHAQESPLDPVDHCVGDLKPYDSGTMGSVTCQ